MSHVILSEERAKNLHDKPQKRGKGISHGDSSAYGLRMTYHNLSDSVLVQRQVKFDKWVHVILNEARVKNLYEMPK